MKTLKNIKSTVTGDKVTITADIVEQEFRQPVQQTTIGFHPKDNVHFIRWAQMSQEAFFLKRLNVGLAIPIEELHDEVALKIEPRLTYAPIYKKGESPLTVEFNTELEPTLQWETAEDTESDWVPLKGQTSSKLNLDSVPKGQWVRCKASSEAGWTTTPPIQIK